ncbi:MAG: valine--tRNA ligase [Ruminococcaceae bacterium]|nr:valine--tRNA ligase [Oscillospiraceae bacterium]
MEQKNLEKVYNPKEFEEKIYEMWSENGYFGADPVSKKEAFSIVIPPPNVTGQLHMGHALNVTLQDILVRYKRMAGFETLWVPGYDHAGIATQIKVEEVLRKEEGLTRYDLGREKFLDRVWDWKNKYGSTIVNQIKRMGCSCDWSRERFTMDEGCSKAVRRVFVDLYEKGLIYQGSRIINWCPNCITALSDAEVEYQEQAGHFWHIKYPVKDSDEYVILATTRPETLLGDTAVAVNPNDERYKHLVGKTLILPLVGREIPLIADDYVDMEFGTGVVKITPAHDPNDFEVGLRHNLEQIKVLNDDATVNEHGGKYCGLDRYEARKQMVKDLEEQGLLVEVEDHAHNVGQCYRCGTTVEPMTSKQWFVKMEPLAVEALRVVKDGTISFIPDRFSKTYLNWMENVHDWCISRQLWWGHRIPAFYCDKCGETTVSEHDITTCPKCGGNVKQDEDVLDTWFSSALWPFSTLGWPEDTEELKKFYPTSVLVTAYDIIFFWVARMIFSGMEQKKEMPFKHVFIHGIVRDEQGRKMSKSLGNGIDPLKVIDEYGTDALRFTLVTGNSPGNDIRFSWDRVASSRNFANKIWNASRFVLMNLNVDSCDLPDESLLQTEDKWILSRLNKVAAQVNENLDKYELGIASANLYDFIWDEFCDWYIELVKPRLYGEDKDANESAQRVLCYVLSKTLCLLHPFMPFITEEIWQCLPHGEEESIMVQAYPTYSDALSFEQEENKMEQIMQMIKSIRNLRSEMNVPPSRKAQVMVVTEASDVFGSASPFFEKLCSASGLTVLADESGIPEDTVSVVIPGAKAFLPLGELVDKQKELERLEKEKSRLEDEIKRVDGKLANEKFVSKAPAHLVEQEREKKQKYQEMLDEILASIEKMK